MSIFGAMFSGVSGLSSQSQALGMISDNISNVNTTGYKRTRARFSTLVTQNATQNSFSPGGVRANPFQEVATQGLLQASASQTDVAIVGSGFFVVNEASAPGLTNEFLYTRAGSFAPDKSGFLRNTAGFYLMGFPTDANGVPTVGNTSVLSSLSAINVAGISGSATPTTQIGIGANLPATAAIGSTQNVTVQVFDSLGVDHNLSLTFTKAAQNQWDVNATPPRGAQLTVLDDPNGIPYRAAGRMDFDAIPTDGETVTITDATNGALTFEFDTNAAVTAGNIRVNLTGLTTTAEVATALQTAYANFSGSYNATNETNNVVLGGGNIATFPTPVLTPAATGISTAVDALVQALPGMTAGSLQLDVEIAGGGTEIRFTGMAGLKYGIDGGAAGAAGADSGNLVGATTVELYVNDGTNDVLIGTMNMGAAPTLGAGPPVDGAYGNITLDTFTRQAGDTRMTVGTGIDAASLFLQQGSATDGALTVDLSGMTITPTNNPPAAITQATGATNVYTIPQAASYATAGIVFNSDGTPASFNVGSVDLTYSNGAAASTGVTIDFGTPGQGDAMTQFASDFIIYFITQNGVRFGSFNGVTIGEDGLVTALFDNGQSTPIFQIPIVTFPNPNGLFAKSGNVFAESDASGNGLLNTAGAGSAGTIASGSLEASTVDIATEFTNMIITQQAYSASARIITTADEMLDEVVRIAR